MATHVDPLGPRSEERLFKMHKDVINPKPVDSLASVLHTIEDWEGEMEEYYRCGGDTLAPKTKMMTVRGVLPADTAASVHLALKCITDFEGFKRELRTTLQFLKDYGGVSSRPRAAHLVGDLASHRSAQDNST